MSDTDETPPGAARATEAQDTEAQDTDTDTATGEERLRYLGATTRRKGTGDEPSTLPSFPASELDIEDIQPGVTGSVTGDASGDAAPKHRKER